MVVATPQKKMKENFEFTSEGEGSGGEGYNHPVRLRRPPLQKRGIVNHPPKEGNTTRLSGTPPGEEN
jgi:hypothetical protein